MASATGSSQTTFTSQSVSNSSTTLVDEYANNPYFLPANENPGFVLTSQPLIGPENYMSWARSVFLALSSRNKFGFVNGSIAEPDLSSRLFNSWSRCNTTVLSWLTNSLSMELKASVMYINNAKDLCYQPFTVCSCACICGSKASQLDVQHKELVFRFLMGLNDSYSNLIGQMLLIEPFPSLSKVCSLVIQEEKRRNIGHGITGYNIEANADAAMFVNHNKGQFQHFNGGKGGGYSKKERPICTYCGLIGHIADKCYKLHGYPPGYKLKGGHKIMANQVVGSLPQIGLQSEIMPQTQQPSLTQCPIT
ncbi:uncharacterized protein LOC131148133 [Malania oleifera]|uniref:uncharacterized protein LOC131148133 n=1 Tax=Malania oleifera TaxID=397392 RepID=UPI0025ADED8D|nr:uncharacterized protein LOC131148133 [Malania oleifera]